MANEQQLRILKKGGVAWSRWRAKNLKVRLDLKRALLNDAQLGCKDLSGADFSGAAMFAVELGGAKLVGANLTGAFLERANLNGADLSGADIGRAQLRWTDLSFAQLCDSILLEAHLEQVNLSHARLVGATLRRAYLWEAHLNGADLSNAHLDGADLRDADLAGANLKDASLKGVHLNGADLSGADLSGADLSRADLRGADVIGANLAGADVSQSKIGSTVFGHLDLSQIKGLDVVEHDGPSTIGIDTMYKSRSPVPDIFLRGCGVPEDFITYARSLVGTANRFYSCFISYSHADKSFARRLHDQLQARGIRCWLDEHQILRGDDVYEAVDRGIKLWDKVLLCASKHSLTSWWVDDEISRAFDKEQKLMRERREKVLALIPLNLDGYLFSGKWKSAKATQVKQRLAADFKGWKRNAVKFDREFEELVKALRTDRGTEQPPLTRL